ncbi:hypothetical protein O181_002230 [Austropuccinia psidii MF-1]|uniref:Uncharacterized protein n=1 Tax=Austropuccinia psidii MF-1 TaxID=1389203 RepID=A0A9Q3BC16_9BASI|nr:hypothetical protein [Austropuccinia psidii MF-1]MBW0462515.1 hypothetical protein [Austropuccinia psidii MF-1]
MILIHLPLFASSYDKRFSYRLHIRPRLSLFKTHLENLVIYFESSLHALHIGFTFARFLTLECQRGEVERVRSQKVNIQNVWRI